jgi:glycosyltransferase involved in cell wall biosynthesis
MRVGFANWSQRRAGGAEAYVEFAASALSRLGHTVALWSERDEPADRRPLQLPDGTSRWCTQHDGVEQSLQMLARWEPSVIFVHGLVDPGLERRLLGVAPAVLLAHSYYGTCISGGKTHMFPTPKPCSRVLGPACLACFYPRRCGGLSPVTMVRDYRRQRERLAVVRRYTAVLTLSAHMRTEYLRHGIDGCRVHELPRYQPDAGPRAPGTARSDHRVNLLFLGRLDRLKGCHLLIQALPAVRAALNRPVQAIVGGDGPDRARCEGLCESVRAAGAIDVRCIGWVDSGDRARLLADTDVLVMPSIWPEPYGLSGLEGVAAGVPVAAFGSGAVPEWLDDGRTGALAANPPTASGLADAIARCVRMGRREPQPPDVIGQQQRRHVDALASCLAEVEAARRAGS